MNKLILSNSDIEFLLKWRDTHKNLVRMGMNPFKAIKLLCKESNYTITVLTKDKTNTFNVTNNGKSLGKFAFSHREDGLCELVYDKSKLSQEDKNSVLTVYMSAMAFIIFGRDTVGSYDVEIKAKEPTKTNKRSNTKVLKPYNRSDNITFILSREFSNEFSNRKFKNSPKVEFMVRGHFRHYKDGKVVWINQYTKGKGKPISTKYKLKPNRLIVNFDGIN